MAMPQEKLDTLMFADEKNFGLITNTCRTFYWASEPSTETTTAKVTSGAAFMVMGFISATDKRLVFLPKGTMKSEDYERELKPLIPMLRKHVYVHDNCGAHSKSRNSGYFARQRVKLLLNWPALSPDQQGVHWF